VLAEELAADEAEGGAADSETLPHAPLAQSIYEAGHHTVFQHAYFQFAIENVSRHFIWSFLHSHPFYNSEQVSQRYVKVKPGTYAVPPMPPRARRVYERAVEAQTAAYEALCARLIPLVEAEYFRVFPGRKKVPAKYRGAIRKKAYEVARYVLPIATFSRLHHTVSALTIFRYYRACRGADAPAEQQSVVTRMVQEILRIDPRYRAVLESPLEPERFPEAARGASGAEDGRAGAFRASFDERLGDRMSRLVDYKPNAQEVLADSVREVLGETAGTLSDDEAVRLALDPARNRLFGEALNLSPHSKLGRCLSHASYTFRKKLSHTADSQNQRHRMTPASRPMLAEHVDDVPDFITPRLIASDATARAEFSRSMERAWEAVVEVQRCGAEKAHAIYLLPNAVSVRFTESGDLLSLHHKYAMRLCYNAQEEIWQASLDEVEEIRRVHPRIGSYLLPPCGLRRLADASPICPEGSRYCGVKVWRLDLSEYERLL
jgi:thymidylate synthase ThyX